MLTRYFVLILQLSTIIYNYICYIEFINSGNENNGRYPKTKTKIKKYKVRKKMIYYLITLKEHLMCK